MNLNLTLSSINKLFFFFLLFVVDMMMIGSEVNVCNTGRHFDTK